MALQAPARFDRWQPSSDSDSAPSDWQLEYREATSGFCYSPGDFFVKLWDATAYQDAAAMPEDEWVDEYDRSALAYRERLNSDPSSRSSGYAGPMLMRELLVSAEYADDWLPFCSYEYKALPCLSVKFAESCSI